MIRGYLFMLTDHTKEYNLWDDLIFKTLSGTEMDVFVPNFVLDLQITMPLTGLNAANNIGETVSLMDVTSGNEIRNINPGDFPFTKSADRNLIELRKFKVQGSADNVTIEVTISSQ